MTDAALEAQIKSAYDRFSVLATEKRRTKSSARYQELGPLCKAAWDEVDRLVKLRSPARVREMEREQGLSDESVSPGP